MDSDSDREEPKRKKWGEPVGAKVQKERANSYKNDFEFEEEEEKYYSDSFEDEEDDSPAQKEAKESPDDNMASTIMNLEKQQRDILRESLSTMKQELPEEIVSEEETEQSAVKEAAQAKPKIVYQNLYKNTIGTKSQASIKPQINIDNDLLEAIRAENESVRSNRKIELKQEPKLLSKFHMPTTSKAAQKPSMNTLLDKIKKLDKTKINKLLDILDCIESNVESNITQSVPHPVAERSSAPVFKKTPQKVAAKRNELVFRVLSTWSHPHVVGLTEIELYDNKGNKMVTPVMARNLGSGPTQPITKLVNAQIYTNDEKLMWIAYLPLPPKLLELVFTLPSDVSTLGGIAVWNYNKSSLDSVKGVRSAEVLLNGSVVWSGTIKRGIGRVNEDYSTEIPLNSAAEAFKNKPKPVTSNTEPSMPKELRKIKQEIEEATRPVSVPLWLQPEDSKTTPEINPKNAKDMKGIEVRVELPVRNARERGSRVQERKGFASRFVEARSIASRGTIDSQSSRQRDISMERKLDNLQYFEASKPQRMLRKASKPKKLPNINLPAHKPQPTKAKPNETEVKKDILDLFIEGHELSGARSQETTYESLRRLYDSSSSFAIPEKPKGQVLTFEILSTWSDPYYVGPVSYTHLTLPTNREV
eukprot:TRINITY_DN7910_c0_g9_i2.p1 TRINITY_DN7910_c0_g9~~TRINITY_DN7910_c0_g9_i2.p1  ORF type:complete len:645 (+),score=196.05 TRINITY_DN7910_c0_g9_i2:576-2510(+)